ncbi:MAG: protein-L-isoaspartate(D-aspartate) O-methyltransferase [Burkholderiales bacterium]
MRQRPSFPAKLDDTLAKNRPNTVGMTTATATKPSAPVVPAVAASRLKSPAQARVSQGHGMESSAVRTRMVQKLAAQGITDTQVLGAMGAIERHRFVDSALINQAYEDTSLPIGLGQTISKPGVVSRMLELMRNGQSGKLGRVLEIGTGCGYQAAVLSLLATEVYSIERLRGLHDKARENLRHLRLANLHLLFGDGMEGYAKGAPYAAIIAAAGGEAVPQAWVDQLAMGGRLVAPVITAGAAGAQALLVLDKTPQGVRQSILEAVHFVPLKSGVA